MRRIERLKIEARQSCEWRGHSMGRFTRDNYWKEVRYSHCKVCGMQVVVDAHPAPNSITIGGEAVALDCGSSSHWDAGWVDHDEGYDWHKGGTE